MCVRAFLDWARVGYNVQVRYSLTVSLQDLVPAAASPLSTPSDYSPCQAPTVSESSQSALRFLQTVFHKKGGLDIF